MLLCNLVRVRTLRHAAPTRHYLKYGLIKVHSANDKIDNILSLRHERDLDVLLLCETWHDSDSVCIRRLHADGMRVIERARPRVINNMSSNHGGVVIAVSNNARLQLVNTGGRSSRYV